MMNNLRNGVSTGGAWNGWQKSPTPRTLEPASVNIKFNTPRPPQVEISRPTNKFNPPASIRDATPKPVTPTPFTPTTTAQNKQVGKITPIGSLGIGAGVGALLNGLSGGDPLEGALRGAAFSGGQILGTTLLTGLAVAAGVPTGGLGTALVIGVASAGVGLGASNLAGAIYNKAAQSLGFKSDNELPPDDQPSSTVRIVRNLENDQSFILQAIESDLIDPNAEIWKLTQNYIGGTSAVSYWRANSAPFTSRTDLPPGWGGYIDRFGNGISANNGVTIELDLSRLPENLQQQLNRPIQQNIININYNVSDGDKTFRFETQRPPNTNLTPNTPTPLLNNPNEPNTIRNSQRVIGDDGTIYQFDTTDNATFVSSPNGQINFSSDSFKNAVNLYDPNVKELPSGNPLGNLPVKSTGQQYSKPDVDDATGATNGGKISSNNKPSEIKNPEETPTFQDNDRVSGQSSETITIKNTDGTNIIIRKTFDGKLIIEGNITNQKAQELIAQYGQGIEPENIQIIQTNQQPVPTNTTLTPTPQPVPNNNTQTTTGNIVQNINQSQLQQGQNNFNNAVNPSPPPTIQPTENQNQDYERLLQEQVKLTQMLALGTGAIWLASQFQNVNNTVENQPSPCKWPNDRSTVLTNQNTTNTTLGVVSNTQLVQINSTIQTINATTNTINTNLNGLVTTIGTATSTATNTLFGFITNAYKSLYLDRVYNALSILLQIHNTAMLSRNVAESIGFLLSSAGSLFGIKDADGEPLNFSEILGNTIENFLKGIMGESLYNGISTQWKKLSAIYTAVVNIYDLLLNNLAGIAEGLNIVGEYSGKIGNALKKGGVVLENAYEWMEENFQIRTGRLSTIERINQGLESVENITSNLTEVTEIIAETGESVDTINEEINTIREQIDENREAKTEEENQASADSQSPPISDSDLITPEDGGAPPQPTRVAVLNNQTRLTNATQLTNEPLSNEQL